MYLIVHKVNKNIEQPADTYFITSKIILIPFPKEELANSLSGYLNTYYNRKYMV